MIFENLFLEKSDLMRLRLYRDVLLIQSPTFRVTDLAKVYGNNYQQTYNNFQSLLKNLSDFYRVPITTFFDGTVIFRNRFTKPLTEYRNFLITNTLTFKYIDTIFQGKQRQLSDFLNKYLISRSTLSRKISSFHDYIKNFGINISFIEMKFVGDEKKIREFIFTFYYALFTGATWPFVNISFSEAHSVLKFINQHGFKYYYRNKVDEYQAILRTAIALQRIQEGYPISRASRLDLLINHNQLFNKENARSLAIYQLSDAYSFNEIEDLFFSFSRTISPFKTPDSNDHALLVNFKTDNSLLWQFILKYLETIANDYSNQLSSEILSDEVLLANLVRIFYSYYVFMGNFPTISHFYHGQDYFKGKDLANLTMQFIQNYAYQYELQDIVTSSRMISNDVFELLLPAVDKIVTDDTIQVKLLLEKDIRSSRELTTFLSDIKGVHLLDDQADLNLADIIVTPLGYLDNLPNLVIPEKVNVIFWNSETNENEFYRIYREIKLYHLSKFKRQNLKSRGINQHLA